MISLSPVSSAGDAAAYYAKDNYYTQGEANETSLWAGQGADTLGLSGPVAPDPFERVLEGKLPDGSIIDSVRNAHRPGIDLTFSAPKSVSLLAHVGGDERLATAVRESAVATLGWIERNLAEARVWDGRAQRRIATGNLVAALFQHDVNRHGEPQAHVHAVIANVTRDATAKWRALHNDPLFERQHVIGAVHNADLRARVEALGYDTVPGHNPVDGQFEIKGVSRDTVLAFSSRAREIDAALGGRHGTAREREIAALATRPDKPPELDRATALASWRDTAARAGFAPAALIEAARSRAETRETGWSRLLSGIRGKAAQGHALAGALGLVPRDRDPLVPEAAGRLAPAAFAAAQAVASAVRDLSQREAAFDRLDLIRSALDYGGPVGVGEVEARIQSLTARGLLHAGSEDTLLTTAGALTTERAILAEKAAGDAQVEPVVAALEAGALAQTAARDAGLRRLSPRQQAAAELLLLSRDRVVAVQGVAGAGKSAVLAPVAAVAREQGRKVIGLAIANKVARDLGAKTGMPATTVAAFIASHRDLLGDAVAPAKLAAARAEWRGAVVMVDEASMLGNDQALDLLRLANRLEVGRLAWVGDTRQLGAVDAGKPFELLQRAGAATAPLPDNLRAASPLMKTVVAALDKGSLAAAFEALQPVTVEVQQADAARAAAALWVALPPAERDNTLLLASGRALRTEANAYAQAGLKARGRLGNGITLDVLDRVTITREGARAPRAYIAGRVVEFRSDMPAQGFSRGDRGTVTGAENDRITLRMASGREQTFRPGKLPRNLRDDAVSVYAVKQVAVHAGDRIRWTDNDKGRGLFNAVVAKVAAVDGRSLTIVAADGSTAVLAAGDRMRERLDLAYAMNAHMAQGVTAEHGIVVMRSTERMLASTRTFLVALTRIADRATLVVDSAPRLERAVTRTPGDKTSALETTGALREAGRPDGVIAVTAARRRSPGTLSPNLTLTGEQRAAAAPSPKAPAKEAPEVPDLTIPVLERTREREMDFGL